MVQDAAITAMARLDAFEPDTDFRAWMSQIVRFTARNHLRQQRRLSPEPLCEELPDPTLPEPPLGTGCVTRAGALEPDQSAFDDDVLRGLQALQETERTCLLLRTVVELPYADIARMLDIPEGTAQSHVHRARRQLVARLSQSKEGVR